MIFELVIFYKVRNLGEDNGLRIYCKDFLLRFFKVMDIFYFFSRRNYRIKDLFSFYGKL